jgi:ribosomal protein S6
LHNLGGCDNLSHMTQIDENIYEVGFHLVPFLSEEQIGAEVTEIKAIIEKHNGAVVSEEFPKLKPLAYEISKVTGGVKRNHDKAFFGFVKFAGTPEGVIETKTDLDKKDTIIRFILIKTIKDNTLYGSRVARTDGPRPKKGKDEDGVVSPISEAEIDKSIEELVIE